MRAYFISLLSSSPPQPLLSLLSLSHRSQLFLLASVHLCPHPSFPSAPLFPLPPPYLAPAQLHPYSTSPPDKWGHCQAASSGASRARLLRAVSQMTPSLCSQPLPFHLPVHPWDQPRTLPGECQLQRRWPTSFFATWSKQSQAIAMAGGFMYLACPSCVLFNLISQEGEYRTFIHQVTWNMTRNEWYSLKNKLSMLNNDI